MLRFVLLTLLNLALPFLVHGLYRAIRAYLNRRARPHVIDVTPREPWPLGRLLLVGLVLLAGSLMVWRVLEGDSPAANYTRTQTKEGRF